MPTSLLDILDSAVKIGLGALISGVATYSVTKLKYQQGTQQAIISKKLEIMEEAAEHLEKFNEYSHECSNVFFNVVKGTTLPAELQNSANGLSKGLTFITKSIGNIQLLGETKAAEELNAYKEKVIELINFVNNCSSKDSSHCDMNTYNNLIDSISNRKKKVLQEMSKSYLNIPV